VPFRGTARTVTQYWLESFLPWAEERKLDVTHQTVVWDNAPSHSAVGTTQTERISAFHRWFREWGFRGVVFTPPRSPSFNPVELCFAYIKRWIRKWAPGDGYTQSELEAALHRAVAKVSPEMINHWIAGCGYLSRANQPAERKDDQKGVRPARATVDPCTWTEPLPRRPHLVCLDEQGTLVQEKRLGKTRWRRDRESDSDSMQVVPPDRKPNTITESVMALSPQDARWAGYGPGPPDGVTETEPEVGFLRDDVYEPEAIVDERMSAQGREFRIRWKGYTPREDTWEPESHLLVGAQQMLRAWHKRTHGAV
jgi:transposase